MKPFRLTSVCAALLLAVNAPAWALNKCVGPNGATVFQDAPCAGQGGPVVVKPASGPGNTSAPTPPAAPTAPAAPSAGSQGGTGGAPANGLAAPRPPLR